MLSVMNPCLHQSWEYPTAFFNGEAMPNRTATLDARTAKSGFGVLLWQYAARIQ